MSKEKNDWYQSPTIYNEIATLTDDVEFDSIKDIEAEFLVPILTPTIDTSNGDAVTTQSPAPSTRNHSNSSINASTYETSNNVILTIPRYILYQFYDPFQEEYTIPKGTKFIVSSVGGEVKVSKMRIIGLYSLPEE